MVNKKTSSCPASNINTAKLVDGKAIQPKDCEDDERLEELAFFELTSKPQYMSYLLIFLLLTLAFTSWNYSEGYANIFPLTNSEMGKIGTLLALAYYGLLFFSTSAHQRSYYSYWRLIVLTASLCYVMALIYILYQTKEDAIMFLKRYIDEELGQPLLEQSYAKDCRIYTPEHPDSKFANIKKIMDPYILAHSIGWIFRMMILRDVRFAIFMSVFFEYLEVSFQNWFPNFAECWWDTWIVDVALCNSAGILVAYYLMKKWNMKICKWFEPNWSLFSSVRKFYSVLFFVVVFSMADLHHFFLKGAFNFPPFHSILTFRLFLWVLLCMFTGRELYASTHIRATLKAGPFFLIFCFMLCLEHLVIAKFGDSKLIHYDLYLCQGSVFDNPFPRSIIFSWVGILLFIIVKTIELYRKELKIRMIHAKEEKKKLN